MIAITKSVISLTLEALVTDDDRGSQKTLLWSLDNEEHHIQCILLNTVSVHTKELFPNITENTDVKTQLTRAKSYTGENPEYIRSQD